MPTSAKNGSLKEFTLALALLTALLSGCAQSNATGVPDVRREERALNEGKHMSHAKIDAIVVTCMDWRLFRPEESLLPKFLSGIGVAHYDLRTQQGCAKDICCGGHDIVASMVQAVKIAHDLHGARRVVLLGHTDCGYYGGSKSFGSSAEEMETYRSDLGMAATAIAKEFPDMRVDRYIAVLGDPGDGSAIEFVEAAERVAVPARQG